MRDFCLKALLHNPLGALVSRSCTASRANLCVRISAPRSLHQDLCIRTLWNHLCKMSVLGSLHQDPFRNTFVRTEPLVQNLCVRTSASGSFCARSLSQVSADGLSEHLHIPTGTILVSSRIGNYKNAILPAIRAINAHHPRRWLHRQIKKTHGLLHLPPNVTIFLRLPCHMHFMSGNVYLRRRHAHECLT